MVNDATEAIVPCEVAQDPYGSYPPVHGQHLNKRNVSQHKDPAALPFPAPTDSVVVLRLKVGKRRIDEALHRADPAQTRGDRSKVRSRPSHRGNSGTSCFAPLVQALSMRRPSGVGS